MNAEQQALVQEKIRSGELGIVRDGSGWKEGMAALAKMSFEEFELRASTDPADDLTLAKEIGANLVQTLLDLDAVVLEDRGPETEPDRYFLKLNEEGNRLAFIFHELLPCDMVIAAAKEIITHDQQARKSLMLLCLEGSL